MDDRMEYAQYLLRNNPYAVHNHVSVTGVGDDWCEGYLDLEDDVLNVYGQPHGGAYFSLADVLAGMSLRANRNQFVTLSATSHFVRSTKEKKLFGRAEIMKLGRSTALVSCRVTDSGGKLLFYSTFDFFRVDGRVEIVESAAAAGRAEEKKL